MIDDGLDTERTAFAVAVPVEVKDQLNGLRLVRVDLQALLFLCAA
nr:hypothetical protein [Limibacillus halophilus]